MIPGFEADNKKHTLNFMLFLHVCAAANLPEPGNMQQRHKWRRLTLL